MLFERHPSNPILSSADWPYPVHAVFNAGAARLSDGTVLLLCRVEDHRGHSHLTAARSKNGVDDWEIDPRPTFVPMPETYPEEVWGLEDPRITWVPELESFAVTLVAYSRGGPCVTLALTEDFKYFERMGVTMPPPDKDAALLPHRIGDHWAMLHRPVSPIGEHIWISYSPDLRHWGSHKIVLSARPGPWWDARKIGLACPPIETKEGWLLVYHGVRETVAGGIYRLGLALLDAGTPERCLLRGNDWILGPETSYEWMGDVPGVIFPCGYALGNDGDTIHLYYGAADTCIGLVTGSVKRLMAWLKKNGSAPTPNRDQAI
jgi:predicted GH43/DUF377 family glycosyl hydrolase